MKDIPVFTTENGVGSLFLREIPFKGTARVKIHSTQRPEAFLQECVQFCRACGADTVYGSGHELLQNYPFVTAILQMQVSSESLDRTDASVFPVLPETVEQWRMLVNEKMQKVANAAYLTRQDEKMLLDSGGCYFVHRKGQLLGLGKVTDNSIEILASLKPGAGGDVLLALCGIITADTVNLSVASTNERALRLYERFGFVTVNELSQWYKIF